MTRQGSNQTLPSGSLKGADTMNFDEWLHARGIDSAGLDDNVRQALQAACDAELEAAKAPPAPAKAPAPRPSPEPRPTPHAPPKAQGLDEILNAHKAEQARIDEITSLTAGALRDRPMLVDDIEKLSAAAIDGGMSAHDYDVQLLRIRANTNGTQRRSSRWGSDSRSGPKVIEAAICLQHKLERETLEKSYDQATLNAASDRYVHGLGLQELLLMAARENGYSGSSARDIESVLRHAFRPGSIAAEFSTLSLPGIFSSVANKFLLQGFNAVDTSWRTITAIRSVNDFKTVTSYSLTGDMEYAEIAPTGEIMHGKLGEESYTNQVKTYGRMFAISRQDIINDDLGALTRIPTKLGRGAALKLNKVFWTVFLSNANTFYTSGRGNISSGAGSALGSPGLAAASTKFKKQTDADGQPIAVTPKILLVPVELEITADELMTSTGFNTGGAATDAKVPNRNVWTNKYTVVSSPYLSDSTITGSSAVKWYLLADPNDVPVIEVAFLNGKETPTVEQADADFNLLGVQFRGYHDWGVGQQDYRGAVRSEGS
jgi:phage major head subunit gpT-like protein